VSASPVDDTLQRVGFRARRRRHLLERGLSLVDARLISEEPARTFNEAIRLLDRDCPPHLVRRIVL
jgi:hypothetical protein